MPPNIRGKIRQVSTEDSCHYFHTILQTSIYIHFHLGNDVQGQAQSPFRGLFRENGLQFLWVPCADAGGEVGELERIVDVDGTFAEEGETTNEHGVEVYHFLDGAQDLLAIGANHV